MVDYYALMLNKLKSEYPDLYFKIADLPEATKIGILNSIQTSNIDFNNEEAIRNIFNNFPTLKKYMEVEFHTREV